jgi:hypothetical protein
MSHSTPHLVTHSMKLSSGIEPPCGYGYVSRSMVFYPTQERHPVMSGERECIEHCAALQSSWQGCQMPLVTHVGYACHVKRTGWVQHPS